MKVETHQITDEKAVLEIDNVEPYFINALRRIMLADLPKLAIDDVIIYDNTSPLFDEIIAHRLGLVPIPTDLSLLTFRTSCTCNGAGCPSCTVRYTLSKEGKGMVYSGDLQPEEKSFAIEKDTVPIVELAEDQRIILEVEAILGRGKENAKWQPVQAPRFVMIPEITFDEKKQDEVKEFIEKLPKGIVEIKKNKLELKDINQLPVLESYIDTEDVDFITVTRNPNKYIFAYETDGALSAKNALEESINILLAKYKEFSEHLKKIK